MSKLGVKLPNGQLPATPEEAELLRRVTQAEIYKEYRRRTRPWRKTWRGILTRREADKLAMIGMRRKKALKEARQHG